MADKKVSRVAIIAINEKSLLEMLDFEGGKIHDIRRAPDRPPDEIELVMEHPDLDKEETGCPLRRITPAYHCGLRGSSRVDPPKCKKK